MCWNLYINILVVYLADAILVVYLADAPRPGRRRRLADASSFVELCADQRLPIPDHNFYNILREAGTHWPNFLDVATQEKHCAALLRAIVFLESGQSEPEWDNFPDHMQNVLLDLYYLPRLRPSSPHATLWQRLANVLRLFSPYNCKPAPIVASPLLSPVHAAPPALTGAQINTVPIPDPLLAHPIAGHANPTSSVPQLQPDAPAPGTATKYWAFMKNAPPSDLALEETVTPVLRNAMDRNPTWTLPRS